MPNPDLLPPAEPEDLGDEIARLFDDLDRGRPPDQALPPGSFSPTLDAIETAGASEIVLDLPGVALEDIRVLLKCAVVVIAGAKRPPDLPDRSRASFHLVERDFGRFARAVRLTGAYDLAGATATLEAGELRVRIPRLGERRGRGVLVPVRRGQDR